MRDGKRTLWIAVSLVWVAGCVGSTLDTGGDDEDSDSESDSDSATDAETA